MKFVDDLYHLYKDKLTGDEEDALIIINGILKDFSDEDIKKLIKDLTDMERFEMFALFLYEKFQLKVREEGVGQTLNHDDQPDFKYFH
ncbi:DUF6154 family protein [Halalkalibacter akibai]|uniref:Cytosolic protein n=1 Tax=Halalkalibacter akibai (strain ATCC 43226 / DSM 21942 / CIP 109018 / JCM 9157 / 1139) TaxID=1236973 RepID=W4QQM7_HALA3|nr:DUF6154 family protein [Halalkalibacter akibai]GAE34386.1 hypothetical protein JCM9157_1438 [Halalkalibacter akibai JCM 9157]